MAAIRVDLEQVGLLGLNEELRCTGFRPVITLEGEISCIEFYYTKCVVGLNGVLQEVASYIERYTDANRRPLLDGQGNPVTQDEVRPLYEEDGVTPLYDVDGITPFTETVQVPVTFGVIQYWKASLGDAYIIPDLQVTLNSISIKHKV